jgi:very-short-patch-repair endonuclease/predicted transcriptional regulator of viral defense system
MKGSPKPPSPRPKPPRGEPDAERQLLVDKLHQLPLEAAIVAVAERQHGVVSLPQLQLVGGLGRAAVAKRAAVGRLHRVHRGVYAVGRPQLTMHGRWMAAVLACGGGALLSRRSAAGLSGLRRDGRLATDVCVPCAGVRGRPGIDLHRSTTLAERDITTVDGIPCTTVARTLVDLGDVVNRRAVERAVDQAEVLRVFDLRAVHEVLDRVGPRRGAGTLRAVLAGYEEPTITRRELEERFLALVRAASLPSPVVNAWITLDDNMAYQADFLWRKQRLIVETDGRDVHTTRKAFEHDRERDQRLTLAGFTVVRFTWRQITREQRRVAAALASLLARLARP